MGLGVLQSMAAQKWWNGLTKPEQAVYLSKYGVLEVTRNGKTGYNSSDIIMIRENESEEDE